MEKKYELNKNRLYKCYLRNHNDCNITVFSSSRVTSNEWEIHVPIIVYLEEESVCVDGKICKEYHFYELISGKEIFDGSDYEMFPIDKLCFNRVKPLTYSELKDCKRILINLNPKDIRDYIRTLLNMEAEINRQYKEYMSDTDAVMKLLPKNYKLGGSYE